MQYEFKTYEVLPLFSADYQHADTANLPKSSVVVVKVVERITHLSDGGVKRTVTHTANVWHDGDIVKRLIV